MENRYLEYQISDGYVIAIYNEMPATIPTDRKIAISNNVNFEVGYEFDNYIVVQEVDANGNLTSSCMIKQPDSVKFLRQERDISKAENAILTSTQNDIQIAMTQLMGI
ncbi:hypothetical protein [Clostridium sp. CF012]|uniref:hypothetical protein n=1 Tax=Clostridium sp. CF012 TaxID=2843319 RepID=UPI001C0AF9E8|nr:hypothetical protein [Clostridium sp. CF012]MBU3146849.1 hypothetical protein [Clostridium sp. CF012]